MRGQNNKYGLTERVLTQPAASGVGRLLYCVGPLLRGDYFCHSTSLTKQCNRNSQSQETQPREYCADNHSNVFQVVFVVVVVVVLGFLGG